MSAITIRQLPDGTKEALRRRAAANGRSMEAEARAILSEALSTPAPVDLAWVEALIAAGHQAGGVELASPPRDQASVATFS